MKNLRRRAAFLAATLCCTAPARAVTITPADPATVKQGIQEAYDNGQTSVTIPAGTYEMPYDGTTAPWHLRFKDLTGPFTINATGATFVFQDRARRSIAFENCSNITWNGGVFRRATIPFSQGTITDVAGDGTYVDITVHAGYPTDLLNLTYFNKTPVFNVYDPVTRKLKPRVPSIYIASITHVVGNTFRFHCSTPIPAGYDLDENDYAAWRGVVYPDFNLRNTSNMSLLNATFEGAAGMAVMELCGGGGNHYKYTLTYPPTPDGATIPPLMSSNADAFNSGAMRLGPQLEDCILEGMNDDGIAIHGVYSLVMEPSSTNTVRLNVLDNLGLPPAQIGDTYFIYNASAAYVDQVTVTGLTKVTSYPWPPAIPPRFRIFAGQNPKVYYDLTFNKAVSVQAFWQMANVSALSSGFTVKNCVVRDTRAKGIYLQASDGLVENCQISNTLNSGIIVMPEAEAWAQSDYSRNVIIRNNILRRTGMAPQSISAGGLALCSYFDGQFTPLPGGHRSIVVADNLFQDIDGVNLQVTSADGVEITGNTFLNPMRQPAFNATTSGGPDQSALVWLTQSTNVSLADNAIANAGSHLIHAVKATTTASGSGFTDGVTPAPATVATFTGGSGSVPDAYPGVAGAGWSGAWQTNSAAATASGAVSAVSPLVPDAGNYLAATVTTTSSASSGASFSRRFNGSASGVDATKRHQFGFTLRVTTVDANMRYFIFNRVGGAVVSTDPSSTWCINGTSAGWRFLNGNRAGGGTWTDPVGGPVPLTAGAVYHFFVDVDPTTETWTATISTGTKRVSTAALGFRFNSTVDGEYLHFGAGNSSTAVAATYAFAVDELAITGVPPPSAGLAGLPETSAEFTDGSSAAPDAYPGVAGSGWSDTWKTATSSATLAAAAVSTSPIATGSGHRLDVDVTTTASSASAAAVYRSFDGSSSGVDMAKKHRFSFDVRIDTMNTNSRYVVFNRLSGPAPSTDSSNTWSIIGTSAGWKFLNGNLAGGGSWIDPVNGVAPVTAGKVYHFVIDVDPVAGTWSGSIAYDTKLAVSPAVLGFRASSATDGTYLHFGAGNASAAQSAVHAFSVDNVSIIATELP